MERTGLDIKLFKHDKISRGKKRKKRTEQNWEPSCQSFYSSLQEKQEEHAENNYRTLARPKLKL